MNFNTALICTTDGESAGFRSTVKTIKITHKQTMLK